MAAGNLAVDPVMQLATIGVSGVGAQWVAWRQRVPAIVLMLGIGLLAGPPCWVCSIPMPYLAI